MKTKTMRGTDPRWRARRRGSRFCAPACGRGCTVAEHQRAKELADAMAAKLGQGWRGVIWENMGWHAKVVHDVGIEVRSHGPKQFWAGTETGKSDHGVVHQHSGRGTTPTAAVKNLQAKLRATRERIDVLLFRSTR